MSKFARDMLIGAALIVIIGFVWVWLARVPSVERQAAEEALEEVIFEAVNEALQDAEQFFERFMDMGKLGGALAAEVVAQCRERWRIVSYDSRRRYDEAVPDERDRGMAPAATSGHCYGSTTGDVPGASGILGSGNVWRVSERASFSGRPRSHHRNQGGGCGGEVIAGVRRGVGVGVSAGRRAGQEETTMWWQTRAVMGVLALVWVGSPASAWTLASTVDLPIAGTVVRGCRPAELRRDESVGGAFATWWDLHVDGDAAVGAIAHVGAVGAEGGEGSLGVGRKCSAGAAVSWVNEVNGVEVGPAGWARTPCGARATAYLREQCGFGAPRLGWGGSQTGSEGSNNGVGRFFRGVDIRGRFVFANSAGTDPTFGLKARFRRPYLFAEFGERNQLSLGPEAELRANSSEQDDEDSIILSVPITYTRSRGPLEVPFEEPDESPEVPLVDAFVLNVGPTLGGGETLPEREPPL